MTIDEIPNVENPPPFARYSTSYRLSLSAHPAAQTDSGPNDSNIANVPTGI